MVIARAEVTSPPVPRNTVPLIGSPPTSTSVPSLVNMMVGVTTDKGGNATGTLIRPNFAGVSSMPVKYWNLWSPSRNTSMTVGLDGSVGDDPQVIVTEL